MSELARVCASPAASVAVIAALAWAPITGFPTWPAISRGRFASTAGVTLAVAGSVYAIASYALSLGLS